jgi:hypothetical protein
VINTKIYKSSKTVFYKRLSRGSKEKIERQEEFQGHALFVIFLKMRNITEIKGQKTGTDTA